MAWRRDGLKSRQDLSSAIRQYRVDRYPLQRRRLNLTCAHGHIEVSCQLLGVCSGVVAVAKQDVRDTPQCAEVGIVRREIGLCTKYHYASVMPQKVYELRLRSWHRITKQVQRRVNFRDHRVLI